MKEHCSKKTVDAIVRHWLPSPLLAMTGHGFLCHLTLQHWLRIIVRHLGRNCTIKLRCSSMNTIILWRSRGFTVIKNLGRVRISHQPAVYLLRGYARYCFRDLEEKVPMLLYSNLCGYISFSAHTDTNGTAISNLVPQQPCVRNLSTHTMCHGKFPILIQLDIRRSYRPLIVHITQ